MATLAKSKEKQIGRLQNDAIDAPEGELMRINFRFPQPVRSGVKVVELKSVQQAYGDHVVYRDLNFMAERGQRIVLIGPNGAGKSTLLKILAGTLKIQGGTRELGVNVTAGYFAQQRTDTLNSNATVLENMMDLRTNQNGLSEQKARMILGSFLFRNDDVFKKVSVLSGGEKSRLNLARLLIDPPNFLLMDEPTTHLDISSIDVMIHALKQYEGTLIFISHDVHFIRTLAENVLHVHAGRLTPYAGDYDYYLEKSKAKDARSGITAGFTDARPEQKKSASKVEVKPVGPAVSSNSRPSPNEIKKLGQEVSRLEEVVSKLEFKQSEITDALESPETYRDPGKAHHLNRELSAIVDQITAATAVWEAAGEKLFELEK